jgi:hypothetical protein
MSFGVIAASVAVASAVAGTYMSVQGQKSAAYAAQAQSDADQMKAEWDAKESRKQAKFEEETAQENMRRKRENNKRAIARARAMGARGGLKETGAVADVLVDKADRLQKDVDDLWASASTRSEQLRGQSQMSLWQVGNIQANARANKQASKYAIYGAIAKGAGQVATAGMDLKKSLNTPKPPVV